MEPNRSAIDSRIAVRESVMILEWVVNRETRMRYENTVRDNVGRWSNYFFPGTCNRYQRPDLGMSVKNATRFKTTIRVAVLTARNQHPDLKQ